VGQKITGFLGLFLLVNIENNTEIIHLHQETHLLQVFLVLATLEEAVASVVAVVALAVAAPLVVGKGLLHKN
jgi:hypothetical protein